MLLALVDSEIFPKNHFVTAEAATADIDDSTSHKYRNYFCKCNYITYGKGHPVPVCLQQTRLSRSLSVCRITPTINYVPSFRTLNGGAFRQVPSIGGALVFH